LPESNTIHLLISDISQSSIRATALLVTGESLDVFLEKMRCITEGASDFEKKFLPVSNMNRSKEVSCRNCGKKGHEAKQCKGESVCFYCKTTGHRRYECPKLGFKATVQSSRPQGVQLAAPVTEVKTTATVPSEEASGEPVALDTERDEGTRRAESTVRVDSICNNKCKLTALFDTGSPISFVRHDVFLNLIQPRVSNLKCSNRKFVNIKGDPFDV